MPFLDLPPQMQERVVCSISAAIKYEVAANILLAVVEKEGGKPGQWVRNSNGTFDVGSLQFNTRYLRDLTRYGITAEHVAAAGCYSYDLAAWRLRMHIKNDTGDLWTRLANYHSRTPEFNSAYRADLMRRAIKWADWIEARFATHSAFEPGTQRRSARLPAAFIGAAPAARRLPAASRHGRRRATSRASGLSAHSLEALLFL